MYKKWTNIILIMLLFIALIAIRYFESCFYDPLQTYFKSDYLHQSIPKLQTSKLLLNIFYRYTINSLISILILWVAFRKKSIIRFSLYFYILSFILLIIAFWLALLTHFDDYYLFGFYIRRFLIHPIFILVLLPAFYYQKKTAKP
jgi:exosortase F-associated protein